ncbi:MAG TPA: peptidoglycan recognition family protein [Catenuloplanes sp.]
MTIRRYVAGLATIGSLALGGTAVAYAGTAPAGGPSAAAGQGGDFAAAAREFAVPESLLLAYSYAPTGWDDHGGAPSAMGGYGPLHLTAPTGVAESGRGAASPQRAARLRADPAHNTLARAATLLGQPAERVRADVRLNIRGGAAVLADEARRAGVRPAALADWHPVIARLSGSSGAKALADDVFTILREGAQRTTSAGHGLRLAAQPEVRPAPAQPAAGAGRAAPEPAECPETLNCRFVPAAYAWNNTADANDYGNYDKANRPADGNRIRYIVIHNTEGSYDGTVRWFQNPNAYTSTHYVIRSADGEVTQMVRNKDIAWHAGNWNINVESIGIEHEGVAVDGATWYTDAMYRSSATLVRHLAGRYGIPLNRRFILGHDDIAHDGRYRNSHWDPGPFWDWDRYLSLLGAPAEPAGRKLVTIAPTFADNRYPLTYCPPGGGPCRDVPAQPSNFLFLRTEPRDDAPLLTDPVLGGGTTDVADWTDKAVTGRQYAVAERRGDWTAIWYGGQKAWLRSAGTRGSNGTTVTPKPGRTIPVFAGSNPEPAEWPAGTPAGNPTTPPAMTPIYTISGDQAYQVLDLQPARYFYARFEGADVALNNTLIRGRQLYYRISFNHRQLFVRASDVHFS